MVRARESAPLMEIGSFQGVEPITISGSGGPKVGRCYTGLTPGFVGRGRRFRNGHQNDAILVVVPPLSLPHFLLACPTRGNPSPPDDDKGS